MNHIFKIKFNPQKGTSCVCSELAKQKGKNKVKVTGLATAALLLSPSVYSNSTWNGEHFINTIDNKYLSSTQNSYDIAVDSARNYVTGNNQTLMSHSGLGNKTLNYNNNINYTGNNLQLLNNTGGTNVNYLSPVSIISQKLSPTTTDKLLISNNAGIVKFLESVSIDSTYNFASDQPTNRTLTSKDKNGGYNTAVSVRGTGATEAKTIFNTLSVNLKDHSQGVNKCMYSIGSFCIINSNGLVTGSGNFGLRVAKSGEAKNKAETSVTVENLFDFTSIGDRSLGIYISGNKGAAAGDSGSAKVILNHSNFLQKASSEDKNAFTGFWDSHAIKLGRGRDGEGNGILISTGNMNINTTEVVEGGGIKILGNSQLLANSDTSSTSIKTKGYALEIGGVDDQNGDLTFDFATSKDITAAFNNAVFTTTGTSGDPRIATNQQSDVIFNNSLVKRGELRKDLIFVDQGQQNVQLRFSGNNTNLTAHKDGYILNVSGNYKRDGYRFFNTSGTLSNYDAVNASTVNFIATDSGSMTGLIYKGNIKSGENAQKLDIQKQPKINIDLSNGFIWNLQQSGDKTIALFDNLIIRDGAIIHGATKTGNSKFTLKAQTLDSNNKTILGTITNDSATITLVNGKYNDLLTLDGNYIGVNNAVVKLDSRWNTPGGESGENFESDSIYISGTATGSTKVIPVKQDNTEGYFEGDIISIVNKTLNSLPVITVNKDNNDSELAAIFNGKAATNGIGLANLMSRLNANNQREYYWSLINPTVADDTPPTATTPVDTAPTTPPTATTPVDTAPSNPDEEETKPVDPVDTAPTTPPTATTPVDTAPTTPPTATTPVDTAPSNPDEEETKPVDPVDTAPTTPPTATTPVDTAPSNPDEEETKPVDPVDTAPTTPPTATTPVDTAPTTPPTATTPVDTAPSNPDEEETKPVDPVDTAPTTPPTATTPVDTAPSNPDEEETKPVDPVDTAPTTPPTATTPVDTAPTTPPTATTPVDTAPSNPDEEETKPVDPVDTAPTTPPTATTPVDTAPSNPDEEETKPVDPVDTAPTTPPTATTPVDTAPTTPPTATTPVDTAPSNPDEEETKPVDPVDTAPTTPPTATTPVDTAPSNPDEEETKPVDPVDTAPTTPPTATTPVDTAPTTPPTATTPVDTAPSNPDEEETKPVDPVDTAPTTPPTATTPVDTAPSNPDEEETKPVDPVDTAPTTPPTATTPVDTAPTTPPTATTPVDTAPSNPDEEETKPVNPVDTTPTTPPTATTPVDTAPTTPPTVTTPSVSGKPNNSYGWENLSLKESIPALVVTPAINLEQIADTTPRYNQRFNSHNSIQLNSGNEIWVYYLNKDMDKDGRKRFRSTSNADNLQIGYNSIDNKSSLFLSYSNIDTKFYDQKIKEQYTGKVHSNILNVALSKAFSFNQERSYFDIINQLTYLNNKYEIKDGSKATQKGYAASLSTELGHHFYLDEGRTISISPQTQLMYTRLNLKHMKLDNFTQVASHNLDSLQLRVGARIAIIQDYLKVSTELNIHKQLLNDPRIHIGPDVVQEKYSKTRGEIYTELGVKLNKNHSLQIGNSLSLSLKDKNSKIYGVKLGYSYAW